MITRTCQQCGKTYETYPSIKLQFCSSRCANIFKSKKITKPCKQCGEPFTRAPSLSGDYCSKSCARTAANLTNSNPSHTRDISGDRNPMHGRGISGELNPMYGKRGTLSPRWKGGKKTRQDGYVLVVAPPDHPYPSDSSHDSIKYILEHRLVMERHLGRYLLPDEVVHHIDENQSNNAIENLQLFSNSGEHRRIAHGKSHA